MARPKGTKNKEGHKAGRPKGPPRVSTEVSILETTAAALKAAKLTASKALDSLKWR